MIPLPEIDFYPGDKNKVLLILTGLCGTTKGYQNKYVTIANHVVTQYGWSVFVTATPSGASLIENEPAYINNLIDYVYKKMGSKDLTIYTMGHSAGASILLWYSYLHSSIKRVLAINPVLDWNSHLLIKGIEKFCSEQIKIICGEKDNSARCSFIVPKSSKIEIIQLPNIDHNFTNHLDLFIDMPNQFLFNH